MALNKSRILVVEDEEDIRDLIVMHLGRDGHAVDTASDGEEGLRKLADSSDPAKAFDLLILDWMLPGLSGLQIAKAIRAGEAGAKNVPILMVTARAEAADIVLGLESGADDYVSKPFEIPVLLARTRALLRRHDRLDVKADGWIRVGGLGINSQSHEVTCDGSTLSLTPSEFKLLLALVESRGRVLTRDRLIDAVQGVGVTVVDRAIDTHVFGLRKKLGGCSEVVETVRGVGYRVRGE